MNSWPVLVVSEHIAREMWRQVGQFGGRSDGKGQLELASYRVGQAIFIGPHLEKPCSRQAHLGIPKRGRRITPRRVLRNDRQGEGFRKAYS